MFYEPVSLNVPLLKFNISDLPIDPAKINSNLTIFPVDAYTKLYKKDKKDSTDNRWDKSFKLINQFFNSLEVQQKIKIAEFILISHGRILEFFNRRSLDGLSILINQIGEELDSIEQQLNLMYKLVEFIEKYVPIGDFSNIGNREQDTDILTFHRPQVIDLLSIVLLSKMLTPIFGAFLKHCKTNKRLDNDLKEIHCVTIYTPLIKRKYLNLIDKLQHYIKHFIKSKWSETDTCLFHGYTVARLTEHRFATIVIKDFVNVDLFFPDGHIMNYIKSVASSGAINTSPTKKKPVMPRLPKTSADAGDEGNISQLEMDSNTSQKTFDTIVIIRSTINATVGNMLVDFNIDINDYKQCLDFYRSNAIIPSIINKMMAISYFSRHIGGGKGISFLNVEDYTKIIAIIQMILFQDGYHELAHLITSREGSVKMIPSATDNKIKITAHTSDEYRNCKKKFEKGPEGADSNTWSAKIDSVVKELIDTHHIYNTADILWDKWDTENLNTKTITCSTDIIPILCSFVERA